MNRGNPIPIAEVNSTGNETQDKGEPNRRIDKTCVILVLFRLHKEAHASFPNILSIAMVLIALGIIVNGAICFVMLRGKRFKKNTSNFFILHSYL